ncbi:MAG: S-adenosylmethionine decarboxylase proenzyme [Alphaproteobacteria bacterium MarineAlpha2_Bin1]|nr:MAG: S-adenosylmethionine decarboxylase proenzyme [Alphaproteobacteria bacterium MarineAlpha2_Bin1]
MVEIIELNKPNKNAIGIHCVADIKGVEEEKLKDPIFLMDNLRVSLEKNAFTILDEKVLKFPGINSGVTGFFVLTESHAAFHSYPEYNYLGVDIFSCGPANPFDVIKSFSKLINARNFFTESIERGLDIK